MSDDPPDPLAALIDLPIDPKVSFHRFGRQIRLDERPEGDAEAADRIRALFGLGPTGADPRESVWSTGSLKAEWRPSTWEPSFCARLVRIARSVQHPLIRSLLLTAAWDNRKTPGDRRMLGKEIAAAHLEWARAELAARPGARGPWVHFAQARSWLVKLGWIDEARAVEREVAAHAARALAASDLSGILAAGALSAMWESAGPTVEPAAAEAVFEAGLQFATNAADFHDSELAFEILTPLGKILKRDRTTVAKRRVERVTRELDEGEARGDSAIVLRVRARQALQLVVENSLGRERIHLLNERIRALGRRAVSELKETRFEAPVSAGLQGRINAFLAAFPALVRGDSVAALRAAAWENAHHLEPYRESIRQRGPSLLDLIHSEAIVGDRLGGELTADRRALHDYFRGYTSLPLRLFNRLVEIAVTEVGSDALVQAIVSGLPAAGRGEEAVRDGISAFEAGRHAQAVYTLLPELEAHLRGAVTMLGLPRTGYRDGRQREHTLDVLASTLAGADGDSRTSDFIKAMLSEEDGFNLRNNALHGIIDPADIGRNEALIVIHALLLVSSLEIEEVEDHQGDQAAAEKGPGASEGE